ncbi:unnamed protein product [Bursaphelenchus okinawaensis]|uniref:Nuclear pore membrane glycoprotein 210 n=1 Tax=Bursaphelenchus okinawaensis TaxID=465554 RepID=A0A811LGR3_9BILA|nr:unnamed protein product [Bursaphelenchus okinawaensis]CAG9123513.1 unnamed protein product [Bursaphelenchus okinawaensis]
MVCKTKNTPEYRFGAVMFDQLNNQITSIKCDYPFVSQLYDAKADEITIDGIEDIQHHEFPVYCIASLATSLIRSVFLPNLKLIMNNKTQPYTHYTSCPNVTSLRYNFVNFSKSLQLFTAYTNYFYHTVLTMFPNLKDVTFKATLSPCGFNVNYHNMKHILSAANEYGVNTVVEIVNDTIDCNESFIRKFIDKLVKIEHSRESLNGFRLNVPRVLLPYHPTNQVTFLLEVSHPGGACFTWRSTRPDVASIEPIDPKNKGCSDKALLTSRSKHADEQSTTIFAKDLNSGVTLSCGVSVDVIHSIKVETITDLLFLEAPPARITIDAFNNKGHAFSALGDIPFDWNFEFADASRRSLRIIPFSQSKYDAPLGIEYLEKQKKKGFVVLVEGIQTGSAKLTAKFSESEFSYISPHSIELYVVANLLLIPSEDLYVTVGSLIPYSAVILKNGVTERKLTFFAVFYVFSCANDQYELAVSDSEVCTLDPTTNYLTANSIGNVEVTLFDSTVCQKAGFKPQSAHVYVVEPDSIYFSINRGNNWVLQNGVVYEIENAKFDTDLTDYLEVIEGTLNNTHFKVRAKKVGATTIKSHFMQITDINGYIQKVAVPIFGEQKAEIFEAVDVTPKTLIFPYQHNSQYKYKLKVSGGSGIFVWSSEDPSVGTVSDAGVVQSGEIGETIVHVADYRNEQHRDSAKVIVFEPKSLEFGPSVVEAEIGSTLTLNIKMLADLNGAPVPFTDCRNYDFSVQIANQNVFTVDKIDSKLLLGLGSSAPFKFEGGPRPYSHDPSKYYTNVNTANDRIGEIVQSGDAYNVLCKSDMAETTVTVKVGNRKAKNLPYPVHATAQARLCCSVPSRLALTQQAKGRASGGCQANTHSMFFGELTYLELTAFGQCPSQGEDAMERKFTSIASLITEFNVKQTSLASIDRLDKNQKLESILAELQPSGKPGVLDIQASSHQFNVKGNKRSIGRTLTANLLLNLVDLAKPNPSSIVIWNQKGARATVTLHGGSGQFYIDHTLSGTYVSAYLLPNKERTETQIQLSPVREGVTKLVVQDLCIIGHEIEIPVKVTEISKIEIKGSEFVELNGDIHLDIVITDVEGKEFALEDIQEINLNLEYNDQLIILKKEGLLSYKATGLKIGVTRITVSAISATTKTIRSAQHHLQVFSPLVLDPKEVTLIPESVFELEVLGGPKPLRDVHYEMNNTAIAKISEGLIRSTQTLGYSSITAAIGVAGRKVTSNQVTLKVVSLVGVRIVVSSLLVETGEVLEARVEGLTGSDEPPFSFGGADYPLTVEWTLSKPDAEILTFESVTRSLFNQKSENQFATQLRALKPGVAELEVKVTPHSRGYKQFQTRDSHFSSAIRIDVQDSLAFVAPFLEKQPTIRVTPLTSLPLSINRPTDQTQYKVHRESAPLFEIKSTETSDGLPEILLESGSQEGVGALLVQHNSSVYNNSQFVTVEVTAAKSIHLTVEGKTKRVRENLMPGNWITVNVGFRDVRGRVLHAANNRVAFRPHRFDLTEIEALEDRRKLKIYLKYDGETVLKVWDSKDFRIATYLRLSVADLSPKELKDEEDVSNNLTIAESYEKVKETAYEAQHGIGLILGEFFDNNPATTLVMMWTFFFATVGMLFYYMFNRRSLTPRYDMNSSRVYAYQTSADGSLGLSGELSASPLFHSTPGSENGKKQPTTSKRFNTPVNKAYVNQSSPKLSNNTAGSNHDELFNSSLSPNNRLKQVVNRFYN